MNTKRFLLSAIITSLILASLAPGAVRAQTPALPKDNRFPAEKTTLPAGLSDADWAQINALLPSQQAYLKASNTGAEDTFGVSIAISGDTVVVGAYQEGSAATGVNGDQQDNSAPGAGAAYVFVRAGSAWSQQAYLKASNTQADDLFGLSVAISGDTVVVGATGEDSRATGVNGEQEDNAAYNAGAVYVFARAGNAWSQQAYLKASNTGAQDEFGRSVAISGDTIVIGAPYEASSATGVNGDQEDNVASWSGAAYIFTRAGGAWSQQAYLKASNTDAQDRFGWSVGISGNTVVSGAWGEASSATGVGGDQNDNTAPGAGAAYVFVRAGSAWSQQAYLKASNAEAEDDFGWSIAISGDTLVVGALYEDSHATGVNGNPNDNSAAGSGAAYVFARTGGAWSQQAYLKASNTEKGDIFGVSVAISGDSVVVGAYQEDSGATGVNGAQRDNTAYNAGAAYAFARTDAAWGQQAYLKASNTGALDEFGFAVAIFADTVVVAAAGEDSAATGVNGDQNDNAATDSGSAYAFSSKVILKLRSRAAEDGWILESGENTNKGGTLNSAGTSLYLGDNAQKKQYRAILSFNTQGLPDNAVIIRVTLKVRKQGVYGGGNPVNIFQGFMIDVKRGFFGSAPGLQVTDFQAGAAQSSGPFKPALKNGWYTFNLTPARAYINRLATNGGVTQIRLRFKLDDNNNAIANYLKLYSGNASAASRSQLVIEYHLP